MPFNFRLNLQNVFRRLGIQSGARLPQLNDNVQMTMQVTDLSRLIPAPIEPRGLAGINFQSPVGQFAEAQLHSLSPGGIFIELLLVRGAAPAIADNYLIEVSNQDLGLALAPNINIGGTQIRSRFTAGSVVVPTGGVSIPSPDGFLAAVMPIGIFVPNLDFFSIRPTNSNFRLDVGLVYRELPSVEEVG